MSTEIASTMEVCSNEILAANALQAVIESGQAETDEELIEALDNVPGLSNDVLNIAVTLVDGGVESVLTWLAEAKVEITHKGRGVEVEFPSSTFRETMAWQSRSESVYLEVNVGCERRAQMISVPALTRLLRDIATSANALEEE